MSASAGVVASIVGTSKPRPAGGVKVRLSVLSDSAAAGETIDATGLWVGAQGSGDLPGWQWIATANHGASVQTEKYVTPDQMREVVEKITALGLGGGGGESPTATISDLDTLMGL